MEREAFVSLQADGIPFRLRAEADLTWLRGYGAVFRVMDQQSSGNLCFGVEGPYGRLFIKYAGARTVNYAGRPEDAVERLKRSAVLYGENFHGCLIPLLAHGPAGEGYATIFPWKDAQPLSAVQSGDGVRNHLRKLPLTDKLGMLDGVFDLHALLAASGIIAVDFSDEHVLIDFDERKAWVCDIDLYRKLPSFNTRGRMPGSPRFLAPEEYVMGAALLQDTTVYKMGALAYEFFGDNFDRGRASWTGPRELYEIAERAVREERKQRYGAVREFLLEWRTAVSQIRL